MAVYFFEEDVQFKLPDEKHTRNWIEHVINKEHRIVGDLNFVFCSDEHLYQINLQYLNHDTYTDIITFDNSEKVEELSGDIFISIERVTSNAKEIDVPFDKELHRVLIHGVLHLIGYNDKTEREQQQMREKEDACLSLR